MRDWKDKITKELLSLIRSEKQVVYLLAEVRKKLELDKQSCTKFPTLNMYCCWVLHTELNRKEAINFLEALDFNNNVDAEKITLETFRLEFKDFLTSLELPIDITEDEWFQFRKFFLRIISDTPLINNKAKGKEIKELRLNQGTLNSHFVHKIIYGDGTENEKGVIMGDYDRFTKRKEDRENRRFWRRYQMKGLGRRIDIAKQMEDSKEKIKFEKETEKFFKKIKKEEEKDAKEAQEDMYSEFLAGGDGWD
jgi:hypothetical protein